jgi:hypothetical protein
MTLADLQSIAPALLVLPVLALLINTRRRLIKALRRPITRHPYNRPVTKL